MSLSSNVPVAGADQAGFGAPRSALERLTAANAAKQANVGADWHPTDDLVEQIVRMTQVLFPGDVKTEIDCDPSEPDDPWMNFWATSELDYAQTRKLRDQWHDGVAKLGVPDETRFRLLIVRP